MESEFVILCPDGAWKVVLEAMMARPASLGIRRVSHRIVVDHLRDSSGQSVELLRPFLGKANHALVVRDLHGSGRELLGEEGLELEILTQMTANGWPDGRAAAIVANPEIESWLRFDSTHFAKLLRERARKNTKDLDGWADVVARAVERHGGSGEHDKPKSPKEVFEEVAKRHFGIPTSVSLFGHLAAKESLKACRTPSFLRFAALMRAWFPVC